MYAEKAKVPVYGHLRFKSFQDLKTYFFFDWQFCGLRRHKTANKKSLAAVKQPGGRNQADWDSLNRFLWVSTTVSMSSMKRQSIMH